MSSRPSWLAFLLFACACQSSSTKPPQAQPSPNAQPTPHEASSPHVSDEKPHEAEASPGPLSSREVEEARKAFRSLPPLTEVKKEHQTVLARSGENAGPADAPPENAPFSKVKYSASSGDLVAYLTKAPADGKQHPAIIWLTGGDTNSIGDVWSAAPPQNDQTASAYREAGVTMLFPSQRGGNDNPGRREGFLGEVDDILAAHQFLIAHPYVDPDQVYLGGHSSGATLALLVAASTDVFRAVFAFGPVEHVGAYGGDLIYCDPESEMEMALRSPMFWLKDISSPTFAIEGTDGNIDSLRSLRQLSENPSLQFFEIQHTNHFAVLAPINRLIAAKVRCAANLPLSISQSELSALFAGEAYSIEEGCPPHGTPSEQRAGSKTPELEASRLTPCCRELGRRSFVDRDWDYMEASKLCSQGMTLDDSYDAETLVGIKKRLGEKELPPVCADALNESP